MNILSDLSRPALERAIEFNLVGFLGYFGRFEQVTITHSSEMVSLLSKSGPFSIVNRVVGAQFALSDDIPARIEAVRAPYLKSKLPLRWDVGPATIPIDLGDHLLAQGFTMNLVSPGMAADLHALNEDTTCPDDVNIQLVTNNEMLASFYEALQFGYELPEALVEFLAPNDREAGIPDPARIRNYVATQNAKPVGCSQLILEEGVAGIYGVATIPEARRQGIGAELTLFALREAREMGYRVGVLQSTEMGFKMYASLGFKDYLSMRTYTWKPEE